MLLNEATKIDPMTISLTDFELHVSAHIKRVRLIGNHIAAHFFVHLYLLIVN